MKKITEKAKIKENEEQPVVKLKRKRRKRTPKNKMYFTKDTENAIVKYNASDCIVERNEIFNNDIRYAFEKLAENILNTFKFSYFQCSHEEVQLEVVSNLVGNMHKYKQESGKAFSYFSIIAKNFLILYNNGNYKKFKRHTSVDDSEVVYDHKELTVFPKAESKKKELSEFLTLMIEFWDTNLEKMFKKETELKIAAAVVEIFRKCSSIENFNKKALYLYIREMTNCKTQHITKVINKMKDMQKNIQEQYRQNGYIDMELH